MTAGDVAWCLAWLAIGSGFAYVAAHAEAPTRAARWRLTISLLAVEAGLCALAVVAAPAGFR
jgi:hypothetical protein